MTIEFNCQECDASFEFDYSELMEGEPLVCPECGQRAPTNMTEELANALDEFLARVAEMRSRFLLAATIESDDLPPPYDEDISDEEVDEDEEDEDEDEEEEEDDEDDEDDDDYEDD